MSWTSNDHNVHGDVAPGWVSVCVAFEQNLADGLDISATVCIYYRGKCVVDWSGGWKDVEKKEPYTRDTLQLVFSTSKGVMAVAVALCVDRGWIDYEAPVAQYWPEFAANGKQNITVGQLLSHRAGLPFVGRELELEHVYDGFRITSLLAAEKPHWIPGSTHGDHPHTLGFFGGELVRRVDPQRRSYDQFICDELDSGFYVGVHDDKVEARVVPVIHKPMHQSNLKKRGHRAEMPGVTGITNARSLARIYALLIGDIEENGTKQRKRLLDEKTLARAVTNMTPAREPDQIQLGLITIFAKGGFQLYGEFFNILGEGAFGHFILVTFSINIMLRLYYNTCFSN